MHLNGMGISRIAAFQSSLMKNLRVILKNGSEVRPAGSDIRPRNAEVCLHIDNGALKLTIDSTRQCSLICSARFAIPVSDAQMRLRPAQRPRMGYARLRREKAKGHPNIFHRGQRNNKYGRFERAKTGIHFDALNVDALIAQKPGGPWGSPTQGHDNSSAEGDHTLCPPGSSPNSSKLEMPSVFQTHLSMPAGGSGGPSQTRRIKCSSSASF
jgi:hypothetical protein